MSSCEVAEEALSYQSHFVHDIPKLSTHKQRTLVHSSSALLQLFHASRAVGGLVRPQEYGWSLGDGTCRTAELDEPAVADHQAWRSRPRGSRSTQRTAEPMPWVDSHCPHGYMVPSLELQQHNHSLCPTQRHMEEESDKRPAGNMPPIFADCTPWHDKVSPAWLTPSKLVTTDHTSRCNAHGSRTSWA